MPERRSASADTSAQRGLVSLPRTTASCTPPAIIAASAQAACASRCMVEKVEKITTIQSATPAESASEGQRYARQRRRRNTSVPTIVSASRTNPRSRKSDAKSQCEISALGTMLSPLQIVDEPRGDQEGE